MNRIIFPTKSATSAPRCWRRSQLLLLNGLGHSRSLLWFRVPSAGQWRRLYQCRTPTLIAAIVGDGQHHWAPSNGIQRSATPAVCGNQVQHAVWRALSKSSCTLPQCAPSVVITILLTITKITRILNSFCFIYFIYSVYFQFSFHHLFLNHVFLLN